MKRKMTFIVVLAMALLLGRRDVFADIYTGGMLEPIDISEEGIQEAQCPLEELQELAGEEGTVDPEEMHLYAEGIGTYSTQETAAAYIRSRMVKREHIIKLNLKTNSKNSTNYFKGILNLVYEEREEGSPKEGDYLYWHMNRYMYSLRPIDGGYYLYMYCDYHSDATQEAYVNSAVASLVGSLKLKSSALSDQEKLLAVYDYITDNVSYDFLNYYSSNPNEKIYTAYGALHDKTCVCQGYALLVYRLMREAGIRARLIPGKSHGDNHGWNIVKVAGSYYNVDSTWDSQAKSEGKGYQYFLKNQSDFTDHTRFANYSTAAFMQEYPMSDTSYPLAAIMKGNTLKMPSSSISAAGTFALSVSRPSNDVVSVRWPAQAGAVRYDIYTMAAGGSFIWQKSTAATSASFSIKPPANLVIRVVAVSSNSNSSYKVAAVSQNASLNAGIVYLKKGKKVKAGNGTYKVLTSSKKSRTLEVTGWKKNAASVRIPDSVIVDGQTYKVTRIGKNAFKKQKKLTCVVIGKDVKSIGANAFSGCKSLKDVVIRGKSLKKVGKGAFSKTKGKTVTGPKAKKNAYLRLLKQAGFSSKAKYYKI
ncbi:MAG: leucine-rich repeat protein [Lachnospiraceae bacterium]|nr:leucine-rich repeat protein [Lachnospiraceae bacterium]